MRAATAATLLFGGVACDAIFEPEPMLQPGEATSAIVPALPTIEVTPPGPLAISPGDTVRVRATVQSGSRGPINYESTHPDVATVSTEGLVTGLKPGSAIVFASLRSNPQVRAAVSVSVRSRGAARVEVDRLLATDSAAIDAQAISGTVLGRVQFSRGDAVSLEILLDTLRACLVPLRRTAVGETLPQDEVGGCALNTASYDSATAVPRFLNGPAALSARLVGSDGKVLANSQPHPVRLANRDTLILKVSAEARASDAKGRPWIGGEVTIDALPLLFGGGRAESVSFSYRAPDNRLINTSDGTVPFKGVLPRLSLSGVVDEHFQIRVETRLANGGSGPVALSPVASYDAVAPIAGTLEAREWVGANYAFASHYTPSLNEDPGVGRVTPVFFAGQASASTAELFKSGLRVAVGGELEESGARSYRVVFKACDALLNCTEQEGFTFGVDLKAPTVSSVSLPQRPVNPTQPLQIDVTDHLSGLPELPLIASVQFYAPNGAQPVCGPVIDGVRLPGRVSSGSCASEASGLTLPVPRDQTGYYVYRLAVQDHAGNRLEIADRVVLVDPIAPEVISFTAPSQYNAGEETTLRADVRDNVDLSAVDFRLEFGATSIPFSGTIQAGRPFMVVMTQTFSAAGKLPFVRTLTSTVGNTRTTALVSGIRARVVDAAGQATIRRIDLSPAAFGGNSSITDPFAAVGSATASAAQTPICTMRCLAIDPLNLLVTLQITGDAGLGAFARMFLFARGADGVVTSLGSTSNVAVVETGTQRTYTYTFNSPPPEGMRGKFSVFGVAVTSAGNGLKSSETPIELFVR